jgi:hypothetical protein
MRQGTAPADPDIHRAARLIARRFADMMSGILRDEEKGEAEREGYLIAREVIEKLHLSREK